MLKLRVNQPIAEQQAKSAAICILLQGAEVVNAARSILAYLPFHGEVDLTYLYDVWEKQGKRLAFPRVTDKASGAMEAVFVSVPWRLNVKPGAFGILEPTAASDPVSLESLDLVCVPGVAFDLSMYRLGFGGGFYDRFLPRLADSAKCIGIAYDFQIVEEVPTEIYDVPLDGLCTEQRLSWRK